MKLFFGLFYFGLAGPKEDGKFVQNQETSRRNCGGEINDNAIITSPGFDDPDRGYYYNNLWCIWDVDIPDAQSLVIYPEFFEVETSATESNIDNWPRSDLCAYDILKITWTDNLDMDYYFYFCSVPLWKNDDFEPYTAYPPYSTTAASTTSYYRNEVDPSRKNNYSEQEKGLWHHYSGDFSQPLYIKGGRARLQFMTDIDTIYRGFKLRIESIESCDEIQNRGNGTITSPDWPEHYNHNEECRYTLIAEPGKIIRLTFDEFHLAKSGDCLHDSLTIMGRKHCGKLGERNAPDNVLLIPAGSTVITWKTDKSVRKGGFSFYWESVWVYPYPDQDDQFSSGPLESATSFYDHMESFRSQLDYQMKLKRPKRLWVLSQSFYEFYDIEYNQYFQTEGTCSKNNPKYEIFDFKTFVSTSSMCTNINNFAENLRQFLDNFVCLDNYNNFWNPHITRKRAMKIWHNKADRISRLSAVIKNQGKICYKMTGHDEYEFF